MKSESLFAPLKKELQEYLPKEQVEDIYHTYLFARKAHQDQLRSSGEPYIIHPVMVATTLAQMRMDSPSIIAAILHDVLEDTAIDKTTLTGKFGKEVVQLVDGVSKLTHIHFESQAEAQAENFRKMILAMTTDIRVILIRLADRLHNMRTVQYLNAERRCRIAKETLRIYVPIANRLGMHTLRLELEELGFAQLYPVRFRTLQNALNKSRGNRKEVIALIESGLQGALINSKMKSFRLIGREKHLYSIYRKMKSKHLHFSELMDVYGFRIVVNTIEDCYKTLGVVHNLYKPVPAKFKDYIAIPKSNGYQSLHTILFGPYGLPVEIQIRTEEMDKMAENGIAAHWLYKTDVALATQVQKQAKEWVKNLLELQQSAGNSLEFIENVRIDLFPEGIYVFTPKGDIFELPSEATVVDFAYNIHSDVGNRCIAAKVDRQLVPLSTRLKNGQTVEIIAAKDAHPNPDWLDFVVTGRARAKIRQYLKQQKRTELIDIGEQMLNQSLNSIGFSFDHLAPEQIEKVLKESRLETKEDLLEQIGLGNQMSAVVAQKLVKENAQKLTISTEETNVVPIQIKGAEGLAVKFAQCCKPIPGDPIEGVFTAGHGIVVHQATCNNLKELRRQPDKCLPVRWADDVKGDFEVDLLVEVVNQKGILASLALTVADVDANINHIKVKESDGQCSSIQLTVSVKDRNRLADLIRHMKHIRNVVKVRRV